MHWLDKQSFYTEVNRVLKASGVLAVYGYGNVELSDPTASTIIKEVNLDVTVPAVLYRTSKIATNFFIYFTRTLLPYT